MAQVSVIGLGAMGGTLARVLLERGHEVTVWNRSESPRAAAVAASGAARAASPAAAVSAAPLVIMCVTDYAAADEVLDSPGVLGGIAGRTLVQLTNGTEAQVRAQIARVEAAGGRMLAGGILGYPRHVGRAETVIMYAGDAGAFDEHAATLADLAGAQRYLGEDPGRPNAVYVSAFGFPTSPRWPGSSRPPPWRRNAASLRPSSPTSCPAWRRCSSTTSTTRRAGSRRTTTPATRPRWTSTWSARLAGSAPSPTTACSRSPSAPSSPTAGRRSDAGEGGEDIAALFKRIAAPPEND